MQNPDKPLTPQETILISLTAATDAVWLPSRESHGSDRINPAVTNSYELRNQFRESGIAWSSGGTNDAERKESQRALEDLKGDGAVTVAKPHGSKTLFAKLTDAAYSRTRRLCGLSGFEMGFSMLRLVAHFSVRPAMVMQDFLIPEIKLNGGKGWDGIPDGGTLYRVAQRTLPGLVAGWLDSRCDSQKHVYFWVTPLGWKLLDSIPRPDFATEAIKRDSQFEMAYDRDLHRERANLATRTPNDDGELGWLPLPVHHHDMPVSRSPA